MALGLGISGIVFHLFYYFRICQKQVWMEKWSGRLVAADLALDVVFYWI